MKKKKLLNVGCGNYFNTDWINCDLVSGGPNVLTIDVKKTLPFKNDEFDMVYCSHLLEHLNQKEARLFLNECRRVLKKGGIMRVVVPDLEEIVQLYLYYLKKLKEGQR